MAWSRRGGGAAAVVLLIALLAASAALAQTERKMDTWFSTAEVDVMWMRSAARDLGERLEDARIRRDTKAVNCMESRYEEVQEILAESEAYWMEVRESAAAQDYLKVEETATEIKKNRERVEVIMRFVESCLQKIVKTGGFTEVTDEVDGQTGADPTAEEDDSGDPLPLPPEFEPPEEGTAGTPES